MSAEEDTVAQSFVGDQLEYYRKVVDRLPAWMREATQRYLDLNAGSAVEPTGVTEPPPPRAGVSGEG